MRIAICFFGQIRTGVETYLNFLRYIGSLINDCDIFVHTWDVESISQHDFRYDIEKYWKYKNKTFLVDKKKLSKFYELYNPISMIVEEYDLLKKTDTWGGRRYNPKFTNKTVSLFESMYECNNLKKYYENKYDFKYDYVVTTRPDIVFDSSKSLKDDLDYYSQNNNNSDKELILFGDHFNISHQFHNRIEDIFWVSNSRVSDIASDFYLYRSNSSTGVPYNNGGYLDWQFDAWNYLNNNNINCMPLKNSKMRIYYQSDVDLRIDPLNIEYKDPPGLIVDPSIISERNNQGFSEPD